MNFKTVGNKRDEQMIVVKNAETVNIPLGTPLVGQFNGTDDGLAVVLPSTAGAAKSNLLPFGVALDNLDPAEINYSLVYGFAQFALVAVASRSATTASWATWASSASLAPLQINSVANAFSITATFSGSNFIPMAVLLDSVAAGTGSASNATDTRSFIIQGFRAFIRML